MTKEDRSRTLMIFGLCENSNGKESDHVKELLRGLGIGIGNESNISTRRLGKNCRGPSPRPIEVGLWDAAVVEEILSKSRYLRQLDKYKEVYIRRNLSLDERANLKKQSHIRKTKQKVPASST